MSDLTPQIPAQTEVEAPLISTGMWRGLHTRIAVVLAIIAVVSGLISQSISSLCLGFLMLAGAIALLGEVHALLSAGEVRARRGERMKANRLLVIRREDSPARFYFYVVTYLVLGCFSLIAALVAFVPVLLQHAK